jgi:alpha-beta hydrolase superfamily lysophospholipase
MHSRAISLLDPPPPGLDPYATVDPDHRMEFVRLKAEDGVQCSGVLHLPLGSSQPEVALVEVHPDSDVTLDWRFPYCTRAGLAGFAIRHRYVRDDQNLIMEEVMLDIAAAIRYLRDERGCKRIVLLGHSGGGSTVCFYQAQAETRPPGRVHETPAGDPPDLNTYDLPAADGVILSAAHWGRGWSVLHRLDPSVTNEADPLSVDACLDMYNPDNGFRTPPEPSLYSREFVKDYIAAQDVRMRRLIARARELVRDQQVARDLLRDAFFSRRSAYEQVKIERAAVVEHVLTVYRKEANPKYTDLSLDPSDRMVGSNRGARPDLQNYEGGFHPQPVKARSFLSSESTASNVYMLEAIKSVSMPLLVMCGTADLNEWPEEQRQTFDTATSADKEIAWIVGANHPYLPSGPKAGNRAQREQAAETFLAWMRKRFC